MYGLCNMPCSKLDWLLNELSPRSAPLFPLRLHLLGASLMHAETTLERYPLASLSPVLLHLLLVDVLLKGTAERDCSVWLCHCVERSPIYCCSQVRCPQFLSLLIKLPLLSNDSSYLPDLREQTNNPISRCKSVALR